MRIKEVHLKNFGKFSADLFYCSGYSKKTATYSWGPYPI
jgi:hypothetical protein